MIVRRPEVMVIRRLACWLIVRTKRKQKLPRRLHNSVMMTSATSVSFSSPAFVDGRALTTQELTLQQMKRWFSGLARAAPI